MIQTFLFVRLGEEVVCWNVAHQLQKCCEGEEGDDEDRKPVCTYFCKTLRIPFDILPALSSVGFPQSSSPYIT